MAKKNCKQRTSAIKAMKQCGKAALALGAGAGIGAAVSLNVDYHTYSNAQGLLAIVYIVNEDTGGILVCYQHGVITHDGTRGDYWVPYDKYLVVAKADIMKPIQTELQEMQNLVLNIGYKLMDQKRISCSKYHEHEIGSNRPVKRGKGCLCKKRCGKNLHEVPQWMFLQWELLCMMVRRSGEFVITV
jgi:hypothetical protein